MKFSKKLLATFIAAVTASTITTQLLAETNSETGTLNAVKVSANALGNTTEQDDSYTTGSMNTATKMDLSIHETPQSVSVITRTQMDDFNLHTINDALKNTAGVTVEQAETDRTYYTARGFDITNFQEDGLGIPLYWGLSAGSTDTALYDHIEVVRGADGLMSGVGNPSATINMVRKRPTNNFQASVTATAGSWSDYRLESDVAGALTDSVRGRFVVAQENKDSYLRDYSKDLTAAYGVIEADLNTNTLLTLGISHQKSDANSPMWGALTLAYSDGTPTNFDVSSNTSSDWSYWNVAQTKSFIELNHSFDNGWNTKATYTHNHYTEDSELFYVFGALDPETNTGLSGWTGKYATKRNIDQADIYASGTFSAGNREHDLLFGASWAKSKSNDTEATDHSDDPYPPLGDFTQWRGDTPRPDFIYDPLSGAKVDDKQTAIYAATHIHITDALAAIAGARLASFESSGYSYNVSVDSSEKNKIIPYAGLTYDLNKIYTLYTSYTETFMPQSEVDTNHNRLAPTEGKSSELGIKGAFFDNSLNTSIAVFKAEHRNIAAAVGHFDDGKTISAGFDYDSRGAELEVSGKVSEQLNVSLSYTNLTVDDMQGEVAKTYIPKQIFKLSSSYIPATLPQLKLGASVNWQAEIYRPESPIKQDAYTLIDLFVNYHFTDHLLGAINVNNITDEKYINSIMWDQGFYGTPRNASASLTWKF